MRRRSLPFSLIPLLFVGCALSSRIPSSARLDSLVARLPPPVRPAGPLDSSLLVPPPTTPPDLPAPPPPDPLFEPILIHRHPGFNRVDALLLSLGRSTPAPLSQAAPIVGSTSVGWGTASHYWQGHGGIGVGGGSWSVVVEGYRLTDALNRWVVSDAEGSLLALLNGSDPRIFVRRTGGALVAATRRGEVRLQTAIRTERYEPVARGTSFRLFGGAPGGAADSSGITSTLDVVTLEQLGSARLLEGPAGTFLLDWEILTPELDALRMQLFLRGRLVGRGGLVRCAALVGLGWGSATLAAPFRFAVGGSGTLAGQPRATRLGTRMALLRGELSLHPFVPASHGLEDVGLAVGVDLADAWEGTRPTEAFPTSATLSLALGGIRLGGAWGLTPATPPRLHLRLSEPLAIW